MTNTAKSQNWSKGLSSGDYPLHIYTGLIKILVSAIVLATKTYFFYQAKQLHKTKQTN